MEKEKVTGEVKVAMAVRGTGMGKGRVGEGLGKVG